MMEATIEILGVLAARLDSISRISPAISWIAPLHHHKYFIPNYLEYVNPELSIVVGMIHENTDASAPSGLWEKSENNIIFEICIRIFPWTFIHTLKTKYNEKKKKNSEFSKSIRQIGKFFKRQ